MLRMTKLCEKVMEIHLSFYSFIEEHHSGCSFFQLLVKSLQKTVPSLMVEKRSS